MGALCRGSPKGGRSRISSILSGQADLRPLSGTSSLSDFENAELVGLTLHAAITSETSAFVSFNGMLPDGLVFGQLPDCTFANLRQ